MMAAARTHTVAYALLHPLAILMVFAGCSERKTLSPPQPVAKEEAAQENNKTEADEWEAFFDAESKKSAAEKPHYSTSRPTVSTEDMTPEQLFNSYCKACHGLELVEAQRLDRATWDWVMDDVINEYGGTWITEKERRILVDYLVEHYGPKSKPVR